MKKSAHQFLAIVLPVALAVVFIRCPTELVEPEVVPVDTVLAEAVPDIVPLRLLAKEQRAQEVAAGRRSLFEAAALFGALDRLPPEPVEPTQIVSPVAIPVDTEAGWLCRRVVDHVRAALHLEPDRVAAVVTRLEAEFFAELRAHGAVRLPDPSAMTPAQELLDAARTRLAEQQRRAGQAN